MVKVNVTALYNLIFNVGDLPPTTLLLAQSEALYKALKLEGNKHVKVFINDASGKRISETKVADSDIRVRAMAAFIMKLMERWPDSQDERLQHYYDLPTNISAILDLKKLTESGDNGNGGYSFTTIRKIAENYSGKKYDHDDQEW